MDPIYPQRRLFRRRRRCCPTIATATTQISSARGGTDDLVDGGAGEDALFGGGGNDTHRAAAAGDDLLNGGAGNDTAEYTATIDISDIATNGSGGWTVTTGGAEGTDTLEDIEIVDGAGDAQILLVGEGGFATVQAASTPPRSRRRILIAEGIYAGDVKIDTGVIARCGGRRDVIIIRRAARRHHQR